MVNIRFVMIVVALIINLYLQLAIVLVHHNQWKFYCTRGLFHIYKITNGFVYSLSNNDRIPAKI